MQTTNSGIVALLFLIILIILSSSCVSRPRVSVPANTEQSGVSGKFREARDLITVGDCRAALAIIEQYWDKHHGDESTKLAEQIRNAGDKEYDRGNFAQAGGIYNALLETRFIAEDSAARPLSFNREYLKKKILACSKALTELGIVKYREQRLDDAIVIWKKILRFDPQNRTVEKAISTASKQKQALQQIE